MRFTRMYESILYVCERYHHTMGVVILGSPKYFDKLLVRASIIYHAHILVRYVFQPTTFLMVDT